MKVNLEELANKPDKQVTLKFHEKIDELNSDLPVDGVVSAELTTYGVKIEGHVETDLMLECDRCLKNYTYHLELDIDEKFINDSFVSRETKELELTAEKLVEELQGRTEIDITNLIYQSIILNLPSKKLCYAECPGTEEAQKLGNEKYIDPRLEAFKKFFSNNNDENE